MLFSSSIVSRLTTVASDYDWLSPEQKYFLPGVNGIQEHTFLLKSAIEEAKLKKGYLTFCCLDHTNAFSSLSHDFSTISSKKLPILAHLPVIFTEIYTDSIFQFVVGKDMVTIYPTSGVRPWGGDADFPIFCSLLNNTNYANDVSFIGTTPAQLYSTWI